MGIAQQPPAVLVCGLPAKDVRTLATRFGCTMVGCVLARLRRQARRLRPRAIVLAAAEDPAFATLLCRLAAAPLAPSLMLVEARSAPPAAAAGWVWIRADAPRRAWEAALEQAESAYARRRPQAARDLRRAAQTEVAPPVRGRRPAGRRPPLDQLPASILATGALAAAANHGAPRSATRRVCASGGRRGRQAQAKAASFAQTALYLDRPAMFACDQLSNG